MTTTTVQPRSERLHWLDLTRILCALMILGIHWLRACYKVGLFGRGDPDNIVMDYQSHSGGLQLFNHVLIAGNGTAPSTWLTNLIGLFGGFGWEAVSALILISGFSLALSQHGAVLARGAWWSWYGKRAKRILVPFYIVAFFFLTLYGLAAVVLPHLHGRFASAIGTKMLSQFHTPPLGVIFSHIFLVDPYNRDWSADFLAPAWWFVPAILLAYAAYPFAQAAIRSRASGLFMIGTALLSIVSFAAADAGVLSNETWYYIVLQESFNFALGIFIAGVWLGPKRPVLERALDDPRVFAVAAIVFVIGNLANWSSEFRPFASMLYGPSLVVILAFLARRFALTRPSRALSAIDPYDLYLVHQPFAFPIALVTGPVLHSYAVFGGWFVFVAVASFAAKGLSRVREAFFNEKSRPRRAAKPAHIVGVSRERVR
jgi:peptidoglycan/LPS O-acetylase OafA/YrhL